MTDMGIGVMADGASHDAYVIGADWAHCATKKDALKRMRGATRGLAVDGDGGSVVTTLDETFVALHATGRRAVLSAAALVGAVERSAVVFHELPDERVWVAAIRGGLPLPGCDRVTTVDAAHGLLSEYMSFVPNATVIGTPVDAARSAETVFRAADAKQRAACAYVKPKSAAMLLVRFAAIAVLATVAAFAIQSVHSAREAAAHARTVALAKLNESARVDAAVSQYLEDVRKASDQARAGLAMSTPVSVQLRLWLDQIGQQPLVQKGFRLESASCIPTACRFKWHALPHADLAGPTSSVPGSYVEARDDLSMEIVQPLAVVESQPRAIEDRMQLVSRFHQRAGVLGVTFDVGVQLSPVLAPLPPKPALPPEPLQRLSSIQPVTVGQKATVTLAAPLSLVRETVALVGNAVTLTRLEARSMTTASGAAMAPQLLVTGSYVRLP